jgi:phage gp46-like protein
MTTETRLHPRDVADPELRQLVREAGDAQDAAYDALQAFADALYTEAVRVKGQSPQQADLMIRGILVQVGEELAHDWTYGPEAP